MISIVYYVNSDEYIYKYKLFINDNKINKIKYEMIYTLGKEKHIENDNFDDRYIEPIETLEEINYIVTKAQIIPPAKSTYIYKDIPDEYDLPRSIYLINRLLYGDLTAYNELNNIVKNSSNEVEINFLKEVLKNIKKTFVDKYAHKDLDRICNFFKDYNIYNMEKVVTKTLKK